MEDTPQNKEDTAFGDEFDRQVAAATDALSRVDGAQDGATDAAPADNVSAPTDTVTKPAAAPADAGEDILSGLPENVRDIFTQERSARLQAEHRASSDAARVRALNRQNDELQQRLRQMPSAEEAAGAVKTPEDWKRFEQDYPDIATPINTGLETIIKTFDQRLQQTVAPLQEQNRRLFVESQYKELEQSHPDWQQVASTPDYQNWLVQQPVEIQAMAESDVATDASYVLDVFKYKMAAEAPRAAPVADLQAVRRRRVEQAASPQVGSGAARVGRADLPPDDFDAAWDWYDRKEVKR